MKNAFILLCTSLALGQADKIIEPPSFDPGINASCRTALFSGSRLIIDLRRAGKTDSAALINSLLLKYCRDNEQVIRYALLDGMAKDSLALEEDAGSTLDNLQEYEIRRKSMHKKHYSYLQLGSEYGYWADPSYDSLTQSLAASILERGPARGMKKALLELYMDDFESFHAEVKSGDSPISEAVRKRIRNAYSDPRVDADLAAGIWMPTGHLSGVHEHPTFGFRFGLGQARVDVQLRVMLLFPLGPYRFEVPFEDSLVRATNFGGVSTALEPSVDIFQSVGWKASLVAGLGGLDAHVYSVTKAGGDKSDVSLFSKELSIGLKIDHLWADGGVWGAEIKYSFLDFENAPGTELDGKAITLQLHLGVMGSFSWMRAKAVSW